MATELSRCPGCGRVGPTRAIDIVTDDVVVATGTLCEACLGAALDGAAALREQFEALLDAGVSREEANRIMIERIDGKATS